MLDQLRLSALTIALATVGFTACVTKSVDTDLTPDDGEGGSAQGGAGGEGGSAGGAGGAGGAAGGAGGEGGSDVCVEHDGSGLTEDACDGLTLAPTHAGGPSATCSDGGEDFDPPGWDSCHHGFGILTAGAWELLVECLGEIGTNPEACEQAPVDACVLQMYEGVCDQTEVADLCQAVQDSCVAAGDDGFDLDTCLSDLKPMNEDALASYLQCQNGLLDQPCADIHDPCLDELLTIQ